MLSPDCEPLLVLVNVKSGGCQGGELIKSFRRLLNPFQVFDVVKGGPLVGYDFHQFEYQSIDNIYPENGIFYSPINLNVASRLYVFRNIPKYKILACGGDGTIGWVLQCLDIAKQVFSYRFKFIFSFQYKFIFIFKYS